MQFVSLSADRVIFRGRDRVRLSCMALLVAPRLTATRERVASVGRHGFIMASARSIDQRDAVRLPMTALSADGTARQPFHDESNPEIAVSPMSPWLPPAVTERSYRTVNIPRIKWL